MALSEQQKNAIRHPVRWLFDTEPAGEGELPRAELTRFALGTIGQGQMTSMAGGWFFHFCTNVLELDPVTVGKMTGATTILDALDDPVAGTIIDNHRFRDGRKLVPWIRLAAPFSAVLSFLLFVSWPLSGTAAKVVCYTAIYLLWDIFFSFQSTSLMGMTAAISPHSAQRARAVQWMEIGGLIGSLLPDLLLPTLSGNGVFGFTQKQIYFVFALVLCLGGGLLAMTSAGVTERVRAIDGGGAKPNVFQSLGVLRHNHILLLFLAADVLRCASPFLNEIFMFQQMTYRLGSKTIPAPVLVPVLSALAGLPGASMKFIATKIADRVGGMKRVLLIGCITDIVARVMKFAIGVTSIPRLVLVYVVEALSELPWSIYGIAQRALISDSVDYVEWKTGQRTEGITMAARGLTGKLAGGVRRMVTGYCLRFTQYSAERVKLGLPQNEHYRRWSWPVYQLGPALGAVMSLVPLLLLRYPDSLKNQVEAELAQRREKASHDAEDSAAERPG